MEKKKAIWKRPNSKQSTKYTEYFINKSTCSKIQNTVLKTVEILFKRLDDQIATTIKAFTFLYWRTDLNCNRTGLFTWKGGISSDVCACDTRPPKGTSFSALFVCQTALLHIFLFKKKQPKSKSTYKRSCYCFHDSHLMSQNWISHSQRSLSLLTPTVGPKRICNIHGITSVSAWNCKNTRMLIQRISMCVV